MTDVDINILIGEPMDARLDETGEYLASHQLPAIRVGFQPAIYEARKGEFDEQMHCKLQRVCLELMRFQPSEAAQRLGIRRQSIYRYIKEIRRILTRTGGKTSK